MLGESNTYSEQGRIYCVYTNSDGLGERSYSVTRDIGLYTHILDIIQVFEYEDFEEVILVGHSYGWGSLSVVLQKKFLKELDALFILMPIYHKIIRVHLVWNPV